MAFKTFKYNHVSFFAPERKKLRLIILFSVLAVAVVVLFVSVLKENYSVEVREISVSHKDVPEEFEGYRILQISDLNGEYFGDYQKRLLNAVDSLSEPVDMVILTGDYLADPSDEDYGVVFDILDHFDESIQKYYCLGERDYEYETNDVNTSFISFYPAEKNELMKSMENHGAVFIYPIQEIIRGESRIFLTGPRYIEKSFEKTTFNMDKDFSICVTHAPLTYDVSSRIEENNSINLSEVDYDLCISGHTLGGVIRLPVLGAFYSPCDGFFPQENITYGLKKDDAGRITYITSGLGVSDYIKVRVNNPPEICVYTLHKS